MDTPWRIEMLGWMRAVQGERIVSRFQTHKTAALLAYLAYYLDRSHPREALIELLWPESEPNAGRNSLSKALTSLRHQLESPGVPAGAVLIADRHTVQLNPAACTTDVAAFETALEAVTRAGSGIDRIQRLTEAVESPAAKQEGDARPAALPCQMPTAPTMTEAWRPPVPPWMRRRLQRHGPRDRP
jgi:DNA-binding SARP family transcriptional activator